MAQRAIMVGRGVGVSGIRSKPVIGDHMIIKRNNEIIEESLEDLNEDEADYTRKFNSGYKPVVRISKISEVMKDELDES